MNRLFRGGITRVLLLVLVPTTLLLLPLSVRADSSGTKSDEGISSAPLKDAAAIMKRMKEALEPEGPSVRRVLFTVENPSPFGKGAEKIQKVAGFALKSFPDGKRMLMVMLEPNDVKGMAFLIQERKGAEDVKWSYVPAIRRVREIKWVDQYQTFLGTDFTYADLGFIKLRGNYRLLGEEEHNGVRAYQIQEDVPRELLYYGKIITWVNTDTLLPVERDFYDPAGQLLKKEVFEDVTIVEGVPTALRIRMTDVEQNTSTDLDIREVDYDAPLPDALFDAKQLSTVSDNPIWKSCILCGPGEGKK